MPLLMGKPGEEYMIKSIGGKDEQRLFLGKLGFVVGAKVCIVNEMAGNVIVNIKDTRVAISKELAIKIMV